MAPVNSLDELKARLGIPPETELQPIGRTWVDTLVFLLNTDGAMFLLITMGIVFIYLELHFMTGLLGILSAVCFGLFFWSRFLGGTAGLLEVTLFLLGVACILMEVLVIPGFGVFGVSGGLLVVASLILAANTISSAASTSQNLEAMTHTLGTLAASAACVIAAAVALNRFLPQVPFLRHMILTPPGLPASDDPDSPRLAPEYTLADSRPGSEAYAQLVGERGTAATALRPAGKAQIGQCYVDVISDGPYIPAGTPIEVVEVRGNKVTVRATS